MLSHYQLKMTLLAFNFPLLKLIFFVKTFQICIILNSKNLFSATEHTAKLIKLALTQVPPRASLPGKLIDVSFNNEWNAKNFREFERKKNGILITSTWCITGTLSIPGNIISYLTRIHKLETFLRKLKANFSKTLKTKHTNPKYNKLTKQILALKKKESQKVLTDYQLLKLQVKIEQLQNKRSKYPSQILKVNSISKLLFVRYESIIVIGITGNFFEAKGVESYVRDFVKKELGLDIEIKVRKGED